jgi:ADP-ribosylglycohydrolase
MDEQRIAGALLGVHCGDALGATVEFLSREQIRELYPRGIRHVVGGGLFDWPAGHATDDTDLTRAVLLAYLDPGDDVVRAAADHMLAWCDGDWPDREPGSRPRDIGGATADGLARYRSTGDPRRAGAGPDRLGNGSLMRCIPTALAVPDRDRRIAESEAIDQARGLDLAAAVDGGPTPLKDDGGGLVLDSLTLAVAAVLDPRPLPDVLIDVVRFGKDTDTNGAIAGGLLGARDGISALPAAWVRKLQFRDEFLRGAAVLAATAA